MNFSISLPKQSDILRIKCETLPHKPVGHTSSSIICSLLISITYNLLFRNATIYADIVLEFATDSSSHLALLNEKVKSNLLGNIRVSDSFPKVGKLIIRNHGKHNLWSDIEDSR